MRRLVFAELVVLLAAALLLPVVICLRRCTGGVKGAPSPTLPVSEQPGGGTRKERRVERLRRALHALRLWCRRLRVEPAASVSASTSPTPTPPPDGAQAQGEVPVPDPEQLAAGPEEEGVAAWRERWFGPTGCRALYTIEEAPETEGDVESQCGGVGAERHEEPETPFYTPPASPPNEPEHDPRHPTSLADQLAMP